MKLDERRIGDLDRTILACRVVLIHGDDPILIGERARAVLGAATRATTLGATDGAAGPGAFGITDLDSGEHVRASEALASPMLGASATLVRLRDATDAATSSVEAVLRMSGPGLLLVEAGALPARSRLRAAVEGSKTGVAIACRAGSERDMGVALDQRLAAHGVAITAQARAHVLAHSETYAMALHEAEKLALLAAEGRSIGADEVLAVGQGARAGALDAFLFAAVSGRVGETDERLDALLADGMAPMAVLRALLGHLGRMRVARLAVDAGAGVDAAVAALRPPVFFQRVADMRQSVSRWSVVGLDVICAQVWEADRACRSTGSPASAICRHVVAELGRAGPLARGPV